MPTAWLQHCSALALTLFLPWFPTPPVTPPEAEPSAVTVEASVVGESSAVTPASKEPLVLPGVVIEEIPKGSTLERAGLQVGDEILSWKRLPNPPANPEGAQGGLTSYFDWLEMEVEQAPRGAVVLRGRRGRTPLDVRVEPGLWEAEVRPILCGVLDEVFERGEAHLTAGQIGQAVETWQTLANNVPIGDSRDLYTWALMRIGEALGESREWGKAIEVYHNALKAARTDAAQIAIFEALGKAHERRNEYQAAETSYNSALQLNESVYQESLAAARSLTNLGDSAWAQGALERAHEYFAKALSINERLAPQSLPVAISLNNLGVIARTHGELDRAYHYFNLALQIDEKLAPQGLGVSNSLNNLGELAWARGDLARANDLHIRALQIREVLAPQGFEVAVSLNNLGLVAEESGELDRAFSYYQQAVRIFEILAAESVFVAASLNNLGVLAWARGELERANDYHSRALRIYERLAPESLDMATSLDNLGTVAWARGELGRAESYQLRALQVRQKLAPDSLEVALSLNNLGSVARGRRNFRRAQEHFLRALEIREHLAPRSMLVALTLNNLGDVALARGKIDSAHDYFFRSLQIVQQMAPQSFDAVSTLGRLGDIARVRSNFSLSFEYYSRAAEALDRQVSRLGGSYDVQIGFRFRHSEFYRDFIALLLTQSRFAEAFQILERFRGQTFLTMLSERDLAFTADIPEKLDRERRRVAVLYDYTLKKLMGLNTRDHSGKIETIRTELRRLEEEAGDTESAIRKASPQLAALRYPHPLDIAETQQALDSGTLLLSYSVSEENTTLFALSHSGDLEVKIIPIGKEALRLEVKQLLSLIREALQSSSLGTLRQRRFQAASRELYTALLGPVAERIAASERLLILPDGPLHALPFAALVRDVGTDSEPGGGQYLAEWKPLHVALSATVFAELKQRRPPGGVASQAPIQLAAFGDPIYPKSLTNVLGASTAALPSAGVIAQADVSSFDPIVRAAMERGIFDWQPLPYTRLEVEGIARLFPTGTARTFLGPEALEDRIKSLDPKTHILHLAAHGHTDEHLPSSSFIALTIPENMASDAADPERDNGLLQVWEIFERVRLDADLVVLSACDTGLGEEQGGEGLIGLTRAFQYAGARSVMASLWSVQDQATSELMIRFYKHLRAGLPKDEALRQAQIELIRGPIQVINEKGKKTLLDASAPYYWAGFQVYGDWR